MAFSICTCWPFINYQNNKTATDNNHDFYQLESILFSTRRYAIETEFKKRFGVKYPPSDAAKLRRKEDGSTLLIVAAVAGDVDLVKILLNDTWNASVDEYDHEGNTALLGACFGGHLRVVQALVKAGASLTQSNHDGITPVAAAAWRNRMEVLQYLMEEYSNAQEQPSNSSSLLSLLTTKDKLGRTPKDLAKEWSHHDIVTFIEEQIESLATTSAAVSVADPSTFP